MIYYATTKRDRDRMATAMLAFTGYQPSIFSEHNYRNNRTLHKTRTWRVQDDSIGNDWGSLIKCYLDDGGHASKATRENVAKHRDHSEIPTAHGFSE